MQNAFTLTPLEAGDLEEVARFWTRAHPLHPMTAELLRLRLITAPGVDRELMLAAREEKGSLVGLGVGVHPVKEAGSGGVRWLGVDAAWRGQGVEAKLLDALCERLRARGAKKVRLFATPPYYLRPGVDTRETELLSTLLDLGWKHEATHFNMTVDLARWNAPEEAAIWGADAQGYSVRRASERDRVLFLDHMTRYWTPTWRDEADQAFLNDPVTLFLAWRGEEIAGFAACEVSQCLGGFGPTGVAEAHRGAGLGKRLLWACLDHLKRAGRPTCEIGWIGPVSFYYRACGATLGPAYWMLSREI